MTGGTASLVAWSSNTAPTSGTTLYNSTQNTGGGGTDAPCTGYSVQNLDSANAVLLWVNLGTTLAPSLHNTGGGYVAAGSAVTLRSRAGAILTVVGTSGVNNSSTPTVGVTVTDWS
jgi:hypothetical protein